MSWSLLVAIVVVLGVALIIRLVRRVELTRMRGVVRERERAVRVGSAEAQLQHPVVDLSRCLGCATCVAVCPEDGVLDIVHGQAVVVNGARCQGISACERECPVGAITVTLSNLETRDDVPAITPELEAIGSPGLFLAGEVTAHSLIKTAIEHGAAVAREVSRRTAEVEQRGRVLDLCIVGAGPAGIACSLEAKRLGLEFVTLDQADEPGGTVAKYPRRKLVVNEPVDLPLFGRLERSSYTKEQLIALWRRIATEQQLPIRGSVVVSDVDRDAEGNFVVMTESGAVVARHVCLALGRRGVPQKLGVPGEDAPHVAYSLLDASSYRGRKVLVIGGGDSAVEAAMGLAQQPGNEVVLSYRRESFFRIRTKNEQRLAECVAAGKLHVMYRSEVLAIHRDSVEMRVEDPAVLQAAGGVHALGGDVPEQFSMPVDDVFVMAGGVPPFELLQDAGVSFDPELREPVAPVVEQGTGLTLALASALGLTLIALFWALWHSDYYLLQLVDRPAHDKHSLLRPGRAVGLAFGIAGVVLIAVNLLYLVRRSTRFRLSFGSLKAWMTSHVATGVLALLCVLLHAAMAPRETVGGQAFWALVVLLVTGAIGRYFYAWIPRAANGRELALDEVRARAAEIDAEWGGGDEFASFAREELAALIERRQWNRSFFGRVAGLFGGQRDLRRMILRLQERGSELGVPAVRVTEVSRLARRAHGIALATSHYEDLRAVLSSWRWMHRWVAAAMVLLVVIHIVYALSYGAYFSGGMR